MQAEFARRLLGAGLLAFPAAALGQPRCADHNPLRNLYAGDLHVHTALSLDAATQDTRARPADAYRFARGALLGVQPSAADGRATRGLKLARPLDFAAVTDHAELLGEVELCQAPGSVAWDSWQCRLFRGWPRGAYYLFNYTASAAERLGMCGDDGVLCREAAAGPWSETQAAAAAANDESAACDFTALLGYEWTGAAAIGENLHRNVIFRSSAVPRLPVSFVDSGSPERLWDMLDEQCDAGNGCEWLAIPHNANLSAGSMFRARRPDGAAYTREDAERRARAEPLFEIMQHKGASECFAGGGAVPADEYCGFEQLPYDSFGGQNMSWRRQAPRRETGFLRDVLRDGLRLEGELGADPFRVGVIGSTDTHIGAAGATGEADFIGHGGAGEPARDGVPPGLPDLPEFGPGGLAMVWAEENSRAALFDALRRRETYATSGTRPELRFFGGWDYPQQLCADPDLVARGYAGGVPMGGELQAVGEAGAPVFVVAARRDAVDGNPLQQLQIVKGWVNDDGTPGESVLAVAGDAGNGAGVDPETCTPVGSGANQLCAVWRDKDWRPGRTTWYYARVLENPSCRWSARQCAARGVRCDDPAGVPEGLEGCCASEHRGLIQERAWSSPIWVGTAPAER